MSFGEDTMPGLRVRHVTQIIPDYSGLGGHMA